MVGLLPPGSKEGICLVHPATTGLSKSDQGVASGPRTIKVVLVPRPLMSWSPVHHEVRPGAKRSAPSGYGVPGRACKAFASDCVGIFTPHVSFT